MAPPRCYVFAFQGPKSTQLKTVYWNKRGLKNLLDPILGPKIARLVLTHKDRLLRFGAKLIFTLCEIHNIEVVIINQGGNLSFEEDLAQDVLEIITVFSARLYGSRSSKNTKLIQAARLLLDDGWKDLYLPDKTCFRFWGCSPFTRLKIPYLENKIAKIKNKDVQHQKKRKLTSLQEDHKLEKVSFANSSFLKKMGIALMKIGRKSGSLQEMQSLSS